MRILVTRPEPDAADEAELIAARGHEPILAPLLEIEFCKPPLPLSGVYGLIVTSRNALRALSRHPDLITALRLPLYAVGEATADAAYHLGFAEITTGPGTAMELAAAIARDVAPEWGPLLHLAGETLTFDFGTALGGEGFEVRKAVLYRALPAKALPQAALDVIAGEGPKGVVLMSPRTAKIFATLVARHGLVTEAKGLVCYCLSKAVAEAAAPLGGEVRVAARPREEDVLALLNTEAAS
jgi:uroporphyrinogen-III synthase